jgi:hypothetical protein
MKNYKPILERVERDRDEVKTALAVCCNSLVPEIHTKVVPVLRKMLMWHEHQAFKLKGKVHAQSEKS